jgi:uncharacterized ferritin-like protein (DUF455 family)
MNPSLPATLTQAARAALCCCDVDEKLELVAAVSQALARGTITVAANENAQASLMPGRPERPLLVSPRELQRRSTATTPGHAALIHAVAHIEFNAINLALDAVCRFADLPSAFYEEWMGVAGEEAIHFGLLRGHLRQLGHDYGDFAAHDGLWQMALKTAHDPLARMALVPRVLEARGLDVSPDMISRLRRAGDTRGAEVIEIILRDEVGHVAIGSRWFNYLCIQRGLEPESTFAALLRDCDAPRPVLPLNVEARRRACFTDGELAHLHALALQRAVQRPR